MKIIVCCLSAVLLSSAYAVTKYEEKTENNKENNKLLDKSSNSKPKRDASLLVGNYRGPSYKYLPPSSFDLYTENSGPSSLIPDVYNSDIGGSYRSDGTDKMRGHFGAYVHGQHNGGSALDFDYTSKNNYYRSGQHGLGYGNSYKLNSHPITAGHKGKPTVLEGRYYYSNGVSGRFPFLASKGFSSGHSFSSSQELALPEVHGHVHNGGQEHIYITPSGSSNFGSAQHEVSELPITNSFLPTIQKHPIPPSNYGVPIINVDNGYKKKYHHYTSSAADQGPSYAAGHKGLGHFSFITNKPQTLYTSIHDSRLNLPSFSKAPFKPSTFLGVKYEGNSHKIVPHEQYSPSPSIVSQPAGYVYSSPHDNVSIHQQENYPQSLVAPSASKSETDSAYVPPSLNEISSPNDNYLPPTNTYEVSYSH